MAQSPRFMPVSLFGAAMGVAGLALASRAAHTQLGVPAWIAELWALAAVVAFLVLAAGYVAKVLAHRDAVRAELTHPAQLGFAGSIWIALALVAGCLGPYSLVLAKSLWWIGAIGIVATQIYALGRWLAGGIELAQVNTGWMIAVIGPVPVAGPGILLGETAAAAFLFGASTAATPFVVGLVFLRTIVGPALPDAMKPTTFILLVPLALIYAYAPILWSVPSAGAIETLFHFSLVLAAGLAVFARRAFAWPFTPAWWAFTFPLDALAIAAFAYARVHPGAPAQTIAWIAWLVATAVVAIVLVRTLAAFARGTLLIAPKPA